MRYRVTVWRDLLQRLVFAIVMSDHWPLHHLQAQDHPISDGPLQLLPSRRLVVVQVAWRWLEDFPALFFGRCSGDEHQHRFCGRTATVFFGDNCTCDNESVNHNVYLATSIIRVAASCSLPKEQQKEFYYKIGANSDPMWDPLLLDEYVMSWVKKTYFHAPQDVSDIGVDAD